MNKQPLLILVICFIMGIFFQDHLLLDKKSMIILIIACLGILVSLFFHSYFLHKIRAVLIGLLFIGVGIALHSFNSFPVESIKESKRLIVFKILKKLNSSEKYKKYEAAVQIDTNVVVSILYIPENKDQLNFNYYYKAEAYVSKLKPPLHDFQFDYSKYLKRKNIGCQMYLSDGVLSAERKDLSIKEEIQQKRHEVLQNIDSVIISNESKAFLKGIILADRTEIDTSVVQDFSRSGLIHFLAISGTHIMVIYGLFYFILRSLLPLKLRKYIIIISLLFLWLFAAFIGFGNSVLRSCIMLTVYFIYVLLQRKPDVLHSMALSAFVILIFDTHQLFNIGFQLSFIAVLGIFWLNQPILKCLPKQNTYLKKLIFNTISISASAQLATIPLVLYYFHQFSFISILANFVIVPFSELIIIFSFAMATLITFGLDLSVINIGYDFVIQGLLKSIHWFADFDFLYFENISMNLVEVFLLFFMIYTLRFVILKFNFKNVMTFVMVTLLFFIVRSGFNSKENQREEFLVHQIGKDKIFSVKEGNRAQFWVASTSDREKVIKYIINPYTASRRLKSIELKILNGDTKKIIYKNKIYDIN